MPDTFARDPHNPDVHDSDCPRGGEDTLGVPCTCEPDDSECDHGAYFTGPDGYRYCLECPHQWQDDDDA